MKRLVPFLATLLLAAPMARADDAGAIHAVIAAQIDAFRHDDAARAFSYASPGIQQKFGDAPSFLQAVHDAYPQVYRPAHYDFASLTSDPQGNEVQTVDLTAPDGGHTIAHYTMEHEPDGTWRIAGCELEIPPETAA